MSAGDALDQGWFWRAACREKDPESFFIVRRGRRGRELKDQAIQICQGCPVRPECTLTALRRREIWGIFGGYDMEEVRNWTWYRRRKAVVLAMAEMARRESSESIPSETPMSSFGSNTG